MPTMILISRFELSCMREVATQPMIAPTRIQIRKPTILHSPLRILQKLELINWLKETHDLERSAGLLMGRRCFALQAGLVLCHALVDLLNGALAGMAILFLKQTGQDIELAGGPIQIVVVEFSPHPFAFASELFSLSFEDIFVHVLNLRML